jgi:1,5-anhydro-D-fructose reductase (1,5-anhydro-D-mannitol-forming)
MIPPSPISFSSEIRWGIVGCGDVCEVKSGPGFQKATGSRLVAVMRRDAAKAADYARRHGVERWYADAAELINDPGVDAVYIATPPGSHRDFALQVADAGKPCYVEKPMARDHAECQEMVAAFQQANSPLFVAYYRRCLPRFVTLKSLLEDGRLGPITAIRYGLACGTYLEANPADLPWRLRPEEAGGGLFWDLGSHLIDLFDHLFGPLENVAGESRNVSKRLDLPDQTDLTFTTPQGATGLCRWNFASQESSDLIEIFGQHGKVSASCFGDEPLKVEIGGTVEFLDRPNPPHVHQPLIQTMVNDLRGEAGACPSTGVTAARASRIIDLVGYEK